MLLVSHDRALLEISVHTRAKSAADAAADCLGGPEPVVAVLGVRRGHRDLARGPARLTVAMGISLADGGVDLATGRIRLHLADEPSDYLTGPRTGLSGPGGGEDYPWRFWIPGEKSVSPYKRHTPKLR